MVIWFSPVRSLLDFFIFFIFSPNVLFFMFKDMTFRYFTFAVDKFRSATSSLVLHFSSSLKMSHCTSCLYIPVVSFSLRINLLMRKCYFMPIKLCYYFIYTNRDSSLLANKWIRINQYPIWRFFIYADLCAFCQIPQSARAPRCSCVSECHQLFFMLLFFHTAFIYRSVYYIYW